MRKRFAKILHNHMKKNNKIFLLCGGVGYGVLDRILHDFPKRALNFEASEQTMINAAVGLALSGKIPFCYAITPHLYYAFSSIRNYLNHEKIPVKLVGIGRDRDYGNLGFTHWAEDVRKVFDIFPNIIQYYPDIKEEMPNIVEELIGNNKPCFLNLNRT